MNNAATDTTVRSTGLARLATIIFICLVTAIVIAADKDRLPDFVRTLYSFPGGDKVGHFLLVGFLSLLINLKEQGDSARRLPLGLRWGTTVLLMAVTLEEISQLWFASRTFSLTDLACSYFGAACGGYLALLLRRRLGSARCPSPTQ